MRLARTVLAVHTIGRGAARRLGVLGPLRRYLGPIIARKLFSAASRPEKPVLINGHQMVLASQGRYPPFRMAAGRYEETTTRLLKELLSPGMIFMDIGAHVGYFSLLAAREVGSTGKVFSFEPDPSNYCLLVGNAKLNGYEELAAFNIAMSRQAGETTLFLSGLDNGRHSTYKQDLPQRGHIPVQATTVDTFLEQQGWPAVDLVKIDVEGAERDVLNGMRRFLEQRHPFGLIIELNPPLLRSAGVDPIEFLSNPINLGLKSSLIDDKLGPIPLDSSEFSSLVDKLTADGSSVNLYWSNK